MRSLFLAVMAWVAGQVLAGTASISMDAGKAGPKLNPGMYGIFLEEINHGVDGGLYAELIRNRGFEDAKPPEGFTLKSGQWVDEKGYNAEFRHKTDGLPYWALVKEGGAKGAMALEQEKPLNKATPRSLRLEVEDASGRIGVANEGFWGIGVVEGETYRLSLFAREEYSTGILTARLEDSKGEPCSNVVKIDGLGGEWRQYEATLVATRNEPKARLVILAGSKGKFWLDLVSLFPAKTFKDRAHGLRADLAQMLADLKPGFVRFPGGCVVEGGSVETAYNWKYTIGRMEERLETWGAWNYRRTHGMGFLEYLQFCEDVGAEPLHVGFAGQTCLFRHAENVPMDQMQWVAQNFLDAIEYANGDATTTWGKLRAEHGRTKPFDLKLVEIGNENGTNEFPPRYQFVHKQVKAKYPEVKYIADLSWIGPNEMKDCHFDIEDNHFHNNPSWFMSNQGMYDRRDRKLPPVYVGEVAVTSGEGGDLKGNTISALSEGAYLMGLEKNADVVKMVSYAPLLANVKGRTGWHGMIYFDTTRSFGTVSYYLWKLFGNNVPTYTVKTDVQYRPGKQPAIAGGIGVGTWDTAAEYKDIRVEKEGKVLYSSDFASEAKGWRTDGGKWAVEGGAWRQSDRVVGLSYLGDENWSDYTLTLKARKISGGEGFLVVFGRKGEDKYWWNIGGWYNREQGIEFNRSPVGRRVAGTVETGRWYEIKVELKGRRIKCYLDGKLVHDEEAAGTDRFFASAGRDEKTGELVVKVINTSDEAVAGTLNIGGVDGIDARGQITVLKSDRLDDNNSMENPRKVVPVTSEIGGAGNSFKHEFPAHSLSIMRLKGK